MPIISLPWVEIGDFEVIALRDGFLTVDAKEMFGAAANRRRVPGFEAAEHGRLAISLNCFLIRTPAQTVLVDTGAGRTLEGPLGASYGFTRDPGLMESLKSINCGAGDINFVINTHLHFDHCGGNTIRNADGTFGPAFPRAEYIIQAGEWAMALDPPPSERDSYVRETFEPLEAGGRVRLVEGDATVCPGVEVLLSPGHTRRHQSVKVESRGRVLVILGDLVPTSAHVSVRAIAGFDLNPAETTVHKKRIFEQGLQGSWTYGFVHDPIHPFGRVERPGQRFVFRPIPDASKKP